MVVSITVRSYEGFDEVERSDATSKLKFRIAVGLDLGAFQRVRSTLEAPAQSNPPNKRLRKQCDSESVIIVRRVAAITAKVRPKGDRTIQWDNFRHMAERMEVDGKTPPSGTRGTDGIRVTAGLEGITKSFGGTIAVADVSLALHAGEVLALLGENGAGNHLFTKKLTHPVLEYWPVILAVSTLACCPGDGRMIEHFVRHPVEHSYNIPRRPAPNRRHHP